MCHGGAMEGLDTMIIADGLEDFIRQWGLIIGAIVTTLALLRVLVKLPSAVDLWSKGRRQAELDHAIEVIAQAKRDEAIDTLVELAPAIVALHKEFKPNGGSSMRDRVNYIGQGVDEIWLELEKLRGDHSRYDERFDSIIDWQGAHDVRLVETLES